MDRNELIGSVMVAHVLGAAFEPEAVFVTRVCDELDGHVVVTLHGGETLLMRADELTRPTALVTGAPNYKIKGMTEAVKREVDFSHTPEIMRQRQSKP